MLSLNPSPPAGTCTFHSFHVKRSLLIGSIKLSSDTGFVCACAPHRSAPGSSSSSSCVQGLLPVSSGRPAHAKAGGWVGIPSGTTAARSGCKLLTSSILPRELSSCCDRCFSFALWREMWALCQSHTRLAGAWSELWFELQRGKFYTWKGFLRNPVLGTCTDDYKCRWLAYLIVQYRMLRNSEKCAFKSHLLP